MRKLWIDTDTASDDAVALLMALREPTVQVLGIGVVMGNVSLERAVRNALISVERAGTYAPPVHAGASKPLYRDTDFAVVCHGVDGLSDRGYPDPVLKVAPGNAVDAMLQCARENPHEVELVTLGPLTNVAIAAFRDPESFRLFKSVTIMGGALRMPGNWSPVAEFNIIVAPLRWTATRSSSNTASGWGSTACASLTRRPWRWSCGPRSFRKNRRPICAWRRQGSTPPAWSYMIISTISIVHTTAP